MKDKIRKEYLRRTRKLLETKLSSRYLIKGINTLAVLLVRYSGPFLKWTRDDLKQMDQRTRKLMTMHKALYVKAHSNLIKKIMTHRSMYTLLQTPHPQLSNKSLNLSTGIFNKHIHIYDNAQNTTVIDNH